jgi:phage-related protein
MLCNTAQGAVDSALSGVGDALSGVTGGASSALSSLKGGASSALSGVTGGASSALSSVTGKVGPRRSSFSALMASFPLVLSCISHVVNVAESCANSHRVFAAVN